MKRLLVVIVLMTFGGMLFAQDTAAHDVTMNVVDIALIDLNNTATVVLDLSAPAQGGLDPIGDTDNSKYLQYTSLVPSGDTRRVTVQWGALDQAPAGTALLIDVTVPGGLGTSAGQKTISAVAQDVITAIGSCVTGIAGTDGANVLYTFDVVTPASLVVGDTETVTVTFTLTPAA